MLAKYGVKVVVCEAHDAPGGAAHEFKVNNYSFDSGPSFFAGLSGEAQQGLLCVRAAQDAEYACNPWDMLNPRLDSCNRVTRLCSGASMIRSRTWRGY